jgi:hypothetical protein
VAVSGFGPLTLSGFEEGRWLILLTAPARRAGIGMTDAARRTHPQPQGAGAAGLDRLTDRY